MPHRHPTILARMARGMHVDQNKQEVTSILYQALVYTPYQTRVQQHDTYQVQHTWYVNELPTKSKKKTNTRSYYS